MTVARFAPALALFLIVPLAGAFAQTVSVVGCQELAFPRPATPEPAPQGSPAAQAPSAVQADPDTQPYLEDIVSGAMDELFFSGMIATSQRSTASTMDDIVAALPRMARGASEEYVSWIIVLAAQDQAIAVDKGRKIHQPKGIEYLAVDCTRGSVAKRGSLAGAGDKPLSADDLKKWCAQAGAQAVRACASAMGDSQGGDK